MKEDTISAAIDFSTDELALAVRINGKTEVYAAAMPPRDSAGIASWTVDRLSELNLNVGDVAEWTCGTGPGSFTALRCVAVLTAGFTAASYRVVRGVPSAIALSAEIAEKRPEAARIALLYDGRRGEALALPLEQLGNEITLPDPVEITPISGVEAEKALREMDVLATVAKEAQGLARALPPDILERIMYVERFPVERLLDVEDARWNRDTLLNPIYLRAATHIAPKQPRRLA